MTVIREGALILEGSYAFRAAVTFDPKKMEENFLKWVDSFYLPPSIAFHLKSDYRVKASYYLCANLIKHAACLNMDGDTINSEFPYKLTEGGDIIYGGTVYKRNMTEEGDTIYLINEAGNHCHLIALKDFSMNRVEREFQEWLGEFSLTSSQSNLAVKDIGIMSSWLVMKGYAERIRLRGFAPQSTRDFPYKLVSENQVDIDGVIITKTAEAEVGVNC